MAMQKRNPESEPTEETAASGGQQGTPEAAASALQTQTPDDDAQSDSALDRTDAVLEQEGVADETEQRKLNQDVAVEDAGPCKKHVKVTIPREDIEAQYDEAFSEMVETATVPGFRPGHAPRRLIERRYRKEVADQVKASLLMASMQQLVEEHDLEPISEPEIDPLAIDLPDEGVLEYEFDVEVRPQFDVPDYKGLTIKRPVREITEKDVDRQLERVLSDHGQLVPHDGPANPGDFVVADIVFRDGDAELKRSEELSLRLQPVLRFRDGNIEGFDKGMKGVEAGESRTLAVTISEQAGNPAMRGRTIDAVFEVKDVKRLQLPELTPAFLDRFGVSSEEEMRGALRNALERRLEYEQRGSARRQVLDQLTDAANWDLPEGMVRRQARVALSHRVLEMRRAGFSEGEIRAREAELWQNSIASTKQALTEHFLLDKVAELEKLDVAPDEIEAEIRLLAYQSGESPRRVRARLQKENMLDDLSTQLLERKALDQILEYATYEDVPLEGQEDVDVEAVAEHAGGPEPEEDEEEDTEQTEEEST